MIVSHGEFEMPYRRNPRPKDVLVFGTVCNLIGYLFLCLFLAKHHAVLFSNPSWGEWLAYYLPGILIGACLGPLLAVAVLPFSVFEKQWQCTPDWHFAVASAFGAVWLLISPLLIGVLRDRGDTVGGLVVGDALLLLFILFLFIEENYKKSVEALNAYNAAIDQDEENRRLAETERGRQSHEALEQQWALQRAEREQLQIDMTRRIKEMKLEIARKAAQWSKELGTDLSIDDDLAFFDTAVVQQATDLDSLESLFDACCWSMRISKRVARLEAKYGSLSNSVHNKFSREAFFELLNDAKHNHSEKMLIDLERLLKETLDCQEGQLDLEKARQYLKVFAEG